MLLLQDAGHVQPKDTPKYRKNAQYTKYIRTSWAISKYNMQSTSAKYNMRNIQYTENAQYRKCTGYSKIRSESMRYTFDCIAATQYTSVLASSGDEYLPIKKGSTVIVNCDSEGDGFTLSLIGAWGFESAKNSQKWGVLPAVMTRVYPHSSRRV